MYSKSINKRVICSQNFDLNSSGEEFSTLGDKILNSLEYGSNLDNSASVSFDDDNAEGVDILSSPNHDFFDIVEETGIMSDEGQFASSVIDDNNESGAI